MDDVKEKIVPGLVVSGGVARYEVTHVAITECELGKSLVVMTDDMDVSITLPYEGIEDLFHEPV